MIPDTFTAQDDIRCLVNRMTSIMRTEVGGIERDFWLLIFAEIKDRRTTLRRGLPMNPNCQSNPIFVLRDDLDYRRTCCVQEMAGKTTCYL